MNCDIDTITAAEVDICYMAGTEISNSGTYAVTDINGLAVDLSGIELELQVKYKPEDPLSRAIIVFKTTDGTLTVGGASNNEVTMNGVYQVDAGLRYYDLLRKDVPEYVMFGRFKITSNTTRN